MITGEEFEEAELLWPDCNHHHRATSDVDAWPSGRRKPSAAREEKSAPMEISEKMGVNRSWAPGFTTHQEDDEKDEGNSDEEMIPPHVLVARRESERMAFSVCTGNGRTLKGRDLRRVRNSVLQMTVFLER